MKLFYDLHLHSCLSPCGDNEMTPQNMAGMAALKGLEVVALTDHNTAGNCPAFLKAAGEMGLLALPGMELCTSEEAHVVCLFEALEGALSFSEYVHAHIPPIENRPDIYGEQRFMDGEDRVAGTEPLLLVTASDISVENVYSLVCSYGGKCFPAHVDKPSYSVISALGALPPDAGFRAAEVSARGNREDWSQKLGMPVITNSDAHYLGDISEAVKTLNLRERTPAAVLDLF